MVSKALREYRELSVQAKAAIWFVVCSLLQKGVSFITVPIFTRLLTTEQYGTYSLYLSWLQIFTIITSLNLYYGVFNNGMTKFEEDRNRYISSMQGLTNTIWMCVFVVFLLFKSLWSDLLGLSPIIILLMFLEMLVTPALQFWSGRQRFEYKYKKLVAVTLSKSVLNPILGYIAVINFTDKATARIASVVFTEILFCGTIMLYQYFKGKTFYNKKYWSYAFKLALPVLPHYLSGTILNQGDRVMISRMVGTSEVAFYSVSYNIGMLIQIFTSAINNSFTPWMYQKLKKKDTDNVPNIVTALLAIVAGIILILMLVAPEAVYIFGSTEYANAVYVIPPVAASVFFIFLYNIFAIPQFYFERTKFLMLSSVFAAVINIILNYFFIQLYGYVAAGYTTLFCYILYAVGHYFISARILKKNMPGYCLYDKKMIFLLSLCVIAFCVLSNLLFKMTLIRYMIILAASVICIIKRKAIMSIVNNFSKKET